MLSNAATVCSISTTLHRHAIHTWVFRCQPQPSENAVPYDACRRTRPCFAQVTSYQQNHARLTKEETKDMRFHSASLVQHKALLNPVPSGVRLPPGTMVNVRGGSIGNFIRLCVTSQSSPNDAQPSLDHGLPVDWVLPVNAVWRMYFLLLQL